MIILKNRNASLHIPCIRLIVILALFWTVFANVSFYSALLSDYPLNGKNALFLATLVVGFTFVVVNFLALICFRRTTKPVLIVLLIASSMAAYFMDTYHILIDYAMIRNTLQTDTHEAGDLVSWSMVGYLVVLGILPAILVWRTTIMRTCDQTRQAITKLNMAYVYRLRRAGYLERLGLAYLSAILASLK